MCPRTGLKFRMRSFQVQVSGVSDHFLGEFGNSGTWIKKTQFSSRICPHTCLRPFDGSVSAIFSGKWYEEEERKKKKEMEDLGEK